jgi:hypothetical protein
MRVYNMMARLSVWVVMTGMAASFMPFTRGRFVSLSGLKMSTDAAATICPLLPSPANPATTAEFAMG